MSGVRTKLARAQQHIEAFEHGVKEYHSNDPYEIELSEDSESQRRTYRLASVRPLPEMLDAVSADAIHNLRAPLDHVAFHLAWRATGANPGTCDFPVGMDEEKFKAALNTGHFRRFPRPVLAALADSQPFRGGAGHRIWQLTTLCSVDRHRRLLNAAGYYEAVEIGARFTMSLPPEVKFPSSVSFPVQDTNTGLKAGDTLFDEPLSRPHPDRQRFSVDVSFDRPGVVHREPARTTLREMHRSVAGVIDLLEPHL